MKKIFDLIFVLITIFIVFFIVFNSNLILENYKFSLFWMEFEGKIIFFIIIFFLVYLLLSWVLIKFVFVFNSSKENKLNQKIIKLEEELKINKQDIIDWLVEKIEKNLEEKLWEIQQKSNEKILEKFDSINDGLWKINAEIWYLKSLDKE